MLFPFFPPRNTQIFFTLLFFGLINNIINNDQVVKCMDFEEDFYYLSDPELSSPRSFDKPFRRGVSNLSPVPPKCQEQLDDELIDDYRESWRDACQSGKRIGFAPGSSFEKRVPDWMKRVTSKKRVSLYEERLKVEKLARLKLEKEKKKLRLAKQARDRALLDEICYTPPRVRQLMPIASNHRRQNGKKQSKIVKKIDQMEAPSKGSEILPMDHPLPGSEHPPLTPQIKPSIADDMDFANEICNQLEFEGEDRSPQIKERELKLGAPRTKEMASKPPTMQTSERQRNPLNPVSNPRPLTDKTSTKKKVNILDMDGIGVSADGLGSDIERDYKQIDHTKIQSRQWVPNEVQSPEMIVFKTSKEEQESSEDGDSSSSSSKMPKKKPSSLAPSQKFKRASAIQSKGFSPSVVPAHIGPPTKLTHERSEPINIPKPKSTTRFLIV